MKIRLDVKVILSLIVCINANNDDFYECPHGCICPEPIAFECQDLDIPQIPSDWPTNLERITIRNATLNTIKKNAFRRFHSLEELTIEGCQNLDVIDKFAFKGLQKLKHLKIVSNPKIHELHRYTFSSIGNDNLLHISIKNNGIETIQSFAFKNLHNVRELLIDERCFHVDEHGLSGVDRLDFLTLRGVCVLGTESFANSSRIHNLVIVDSTLNLKKGAFAKLTHVNQIQIHKSRIGKIEEEAFRGIFTVGDIQLQQNHIGKVTARAFVEMENVGVLLFSYNNVKEPLDSPECLLNSAQKMVFTENTLHCSCEFQWIQYHEDQSLLNENYCDSSEAYKAVLYYKPIGCAPFPTVTEPPEETLTSELFAVNTDPDHPEVYPEVYDAKLSLSNRQFDRFIIPCSLVLFILNT